MAGKSKVLVVDWETTGLRNELAPTVNYYEGPQGIELGAVIVEYPSWTVIDNFSSQVQFLGVHQGVSYGGEAYTGITWSDRAQAVHGMTIDELLNAPRPTVVAANFDLFLRRHFASEERIMMCAHNPFGDRYYLRQLYMFAGIPDRLKLHHRMIDSFTAGYLIAGTTNSDDLFRLAMGENFQRDTHNALEDALCTAKAMKVVVEKLNGKLRSASKNELDSTAVENKFVDGPKQT